MGTGVSTASQGFPNFYEMLWVQGFRKRHGGVVVLCFPQDSTHLLLKIQIPTYANELLLESGNLCVLCP